jgi:hypothetical protein
MTSPILFAGGEDLDFQLVGGYTTTTTGATNGIFIDTTAGHFRAGYARYGLAIASCGPGPVNNNFSNFNYLRNAVPFSQTSFWLTARYYWNRNVVTTVSATQWWIVLEDASRIPRLRIRNTVTNLNGPYVVEKVNAAGTATSLGTLTSTPSNAPSTPDKLDLFCNYAVAGQFSLYINGTLAFNYVGDVTTDGITSLSYVRLSQAVVPNSSNSSPTGGEVYSEVIVATSDTRAMSLVTQAPNGAGNSSTWTGSYTQVNGNLASNSNPIYTTTAGQLEEFTVNSLPSGAFSVVSLVVKAEAATILTGPQNLQLAVRTGGSDFLSNTLSVGQPWSAIAFNWDVNPNTSAAWTKSDLNASGFNIGFESVT